MKKAVSVLLALLIMLPQTFAVHAQATFSNASIDFLNSLNITKRSAEDFEEIITRGEFTDMVIRAMNYEPDLTVNLPFTDVTSDVTYAGAIGKAFSLGIIAGNGDGLFYPESALTYAAAIKICVGALGYTNIAHAKGGYPYGYMDVARSVELDISSSPSDSSAMNFLACTEILYNFVNADLCSPTGITDGEISQQRMYGQNLLTNNFKLTKIEGIIKTAGYVSMIPGAVISESTVSVDGTDYGADADDIEKYLGCYAVCWYDEHKDVKAIYPDAQNKIVTIDSKDITSASSSEIIACTEQSLGDKTYRLDNITFVKNGRYHTPATEDYIPHSGSLTLVDNDFDGKYEVVICTSYSYMIVGGVNTEKGEIYPKGNAEGVLTLKNSDDHHYELYAKTKSGEYIAAKPSGISVGSVIKYAAASDGSYAIAYCNTDTVTGTIEELGIDYVVIGGTRYDFNSYFQKNYSVSAGLYAKFLLAPDGTLTAVGDSSGDMTYGYITNSTVTKSGMDTSVRVAILGEDGEIIRTELADKVTFNGTAREKLYSELVSALYDGSIPVYQLVRYSLDSDGKIFKLDTAEMIAGDDPYEVYGGEKNGNDTLTCFMKAQKTFWHSGTELLAPHAYIGGSTVIFRVPKDIYSGVTEWLEEDDFSVIDVSKLDSSYSSYTADIYDMDQYAQPGAVVIYRSTGDGDSDVSKKNASAIVESLTDALDSEGVPVKMLTYWSEGYFEKAPIKDDAYAQLVLSESVPASGDVIRLTKNRSGEITAMEIDVRYDPSAKSITGVTTTLTGGQVGYALSVGTVFSHTSTVLTLLPTYYNNNTDYSVDAIAGILTYSFNSRVKVARYDTKTNIVRAGDVDDLTDAVSAGESNASKVAVISYSNGINYLFIYE